MIQLKRYKINNNGMLYVIVLIIAICDMLNTHII